MTGSYVVFRYWQLWSNQAEQVTSESVTIYAQCTPTDCQSATGNRRSSVGVYQTQTRSSALIGAIPPIRNLNRRSSQSALVGRCVPNVDAIVGAKRPGVH